MRILWSALTLTVLGSVPLLAQHYARTDLTANSASVSDKAANIDGNLLNAWGLSRATISPWWISDNGAGVSTLYDGGGVPQPTTTPQPLVVTIPLPPADNSSSSATADAGKTSTPTGTVFNYTSGFKVAPGKKAIFLFVTEDGTISGWNPTVKPAEAVIMVNRSGKAVYKGCTLVQTKFGTFLMSRISRAVELRFTIPSSSEFMHWATASAMSTFRKTSYPSTSRTSVGVSSSPLPEGNPAATTKIMVPASASLIFSLTLANSFGAWIMGPS